MGRFVVSFTTRLPSTPQKARDVVAGAQDSYTVMIEQDTSSQFICFIKNMVQNRAIDSTRLASRRPDVDSPVPMPRLHALVPGRQFVGDALCFRASRREVRRHCPVVGRRGVPLDRQR